MADKLMYIPVYYSQNYPTVDYNQLYKRLDNKLHEKPIKRVNFSSSFQTSVDRLAVIVTTLLEDISLDTAKRMVGILFTNCFQFSARGIEARALYPLVSLVNHSCIPNLRHTNLIQELLCFHTQYVFYPTLVALQNGSLCHVKGRHTDLPLVN